MQVDSIKSRQPLKKEPILSNQLLYKGLAHSVIKKAKKLCQLNQQLSTFLPSQLINHCWIINFSSTTLILGIDSAIWVAKIRAQEKYILKKIKSYTTLEGITKIAILVRPFNPFLKENSQPLPCYKPPTIGQNCRLLLKSLAQTIEDKELKEAFLRLTREPSTS